MKRGYFYISLAATLLLGLTACGSNARPGEKAKDDYRQSLNDSIETYKAEIDSCENMIGEMQEKVNVWLRDFTTVANEREAAPYMIMTSAQNMYPLRKTGLIARINDSGQFELISALTGAPFDALSVTSGENTATTAVVPNDQALNYRTPELTTVCFTGEKADSVGMLISDNELNPLSVTYLNGGKPVKSVKLDTKEAKVVSYTYLFYVDHSTLQRLQRRVPMLHEKINLLRLHLDKATLQNSAKK